jgi:hypothetical protein
MRVAVLAALVSLAPVTWASAAENPRRDRRADDMREMREAIATLTAVMEAAARPSSRVDDAPWLLKESLRTGVVDPVAMGAIIRWVLYEKEEKVAAAFADALDAVQPRLEGLDGDPYGAAARSVIGVFQGVLRDAQHNRRRHGDELIRDLKPAIDAAADALKQVQERLQEPGQKQDDKPAADQPIPDGPEP